MKRKFFTLMELLLVIAIIVLLAAILLPALNQARRTAKKIICVSQQKQLMVGTLSYATDYRGWAHCNNNDSGTFYGGGQRTPDGVLAYHGYINKTKKIWKAYTSLGMGLICPEFSMPNEYITYIAGGVLGYGTNYYGTFGALSDVPTIGLPKFNLWLVKTPSLVPIWGDATNRTFWTTIANEYYINCIAPRHSARSANFAFVDGHVTNYLAANCSSVSLLP